MDEIISTETAFFSIGVFVLSTVLRRFLEVLIPTIRKDTPLSQAQRVWEEAVLPSIPVFVGIALVFSVHNYPYPAIVKGIGSKFIFGSGAGFFCSYAYRMLRFVLAKKWQLEDLPDLALEERKS